MKREKILKEAKKFNREDCAYIHVEMVDGKEPKSYVSGHSVAILYCIMGMLEGMAADQGIDSQNLIDALVSMHGRNKQYENDSYRIESGSLPS